MTIQSTQNIKIKTAQLFDLAGKELQFNTSEEKIDLSNLQKGVYILKLTTIDGQLDIRKIIKQ